jgi:release factor glutamine methyltransferase
MLRFKKVIGFLELKESFFDLIVSNPPYIKPDDPHLQRGDVRFEPVSALVSEDSRYLIFAIDSQLMPKNFLNSGGWLAILEHAYDQGCR